MITIKANNVTLPSPTAIKTSDEIIWSANTGRSSTGKMIGDVVAEKKTIDINWGVLTKAEYESIKSNLRSGFHPFKLSIDGDETTITSYRSALAGELLGTHGGVTYYKSVNVTIIQQ
jgi:hypothetical protein